MSMARDPQSAYLNRNTIQRFRAVVTGIDTSGTDPQVTDINGIALTVDTFGYKRKIGRSTIVGSGALPQTGEEWIIDCSLGPWTFMSRVNPVIPSVTGVEGVGPALGSIGLIDYTPDPPAPPPPPPKILGESTSRSSAIATPVVTGTPVTQISYNSTPSASRTVTSTTLVTVTQFATWPFYKRYSETSLRFQVNEANYVTGAVGNILYGFKDSVTGTLQTQNNFFFNQLSVLNQVAWVYDWTGLAKGLHTFTFAVGSPTASCVYNIDSVACRLNGIIFEVWP